MVWGFVWLTCLKVLLNGGFSPVFEVNIRNSNYILPLSLHHGIWVIYFFLYFPVFFKICAITACYFTVKGKYGFLCLPTVSVGALSAVAPNEYRLKWDKGSWVAAQAEQAGCRYSWAGLPVLPLDLCSFSHPACLSLEWAPFSGRWSQYSIRGF